MVRWSKDCDEEHQLLLNDGGGKRLVRICDLSLSSAAASGCRAG